MKNYRVLVTNTADKVLAEFVVEATKSEEAENLAIREFRLDHPRYGDDGLRATTTELK